MGIQHIRKLAFQIIKRIFTNGAWTTGYTLGKKIKLEPYYIRYLKLNARKVKKTYENILES